MPDWFTDLDMPDHGVAWLRVPTSGEPLRAHACGHPRSWRCHFLRVHEKGRLYGCRCLARETGECPLCELGSQARVRYVIPCWYNESIHYLEVGRTQWSDLLAVGVHGWHGTPIVLWRDAPGRTGRIRLAVDALSDADDSVPRIDAAEFVAGLGRSALQTVLRLLERERREPVVPGEGQRRQTKSVVQGNGTGKGTGTGTGTGCSNTARDWRRTSR